jgi:hypothetical protein
MIRNINNTIAIVLTVFTSLLMSCGEDTPSPTINIDEPDTYTFTRNGSSSVSFTGQTTRIAMAEELFSALKNDTNSTATLTAMFDHQEGENNFLCF